MFFSAAAVVLAVSSLAIASPLKERAPCNTPSEGTCKVLFSSCIAQGNSALTNPWSNAACVAAAICFDGGVDAMLSAANCAIKGNTDNAATGRSVARFGTNSLFNNGNSATSQNFVDFYYGTLSSINSNTWPDFNFVLNLWKGVQGWTKFCDANVPVSNLADYLQYNGNLGSCGSSGCAKPVDPSCNVLFSACVVDGDSSAPWTDPACALAATCFDGGLTAFATALSCATNGAASSSARSYPRLTQSSFNLLATGSSISQQQYIDAYYGELTCLGSTVGVDFYFVVAKFAAVAQWAGFSNNKIIPYGNFADYLTWYTQ